MARAVPRFNDPNNHNKRVLRADYKPAMSFEEIAARLECNRQTVWMAYARGLDKIRRELRRHPQQYPELLK